MLNNIKHFLFIILTFLCLLTPISTHSAENQPESESVARTEIEKEMDDITKRFILAAFGKQALSWFSVDSELNYINEIEDEEITDFSRPFNKNNFAMLKSYIIISLVIGFIVFSVYLFWIIKEGIIKSQNSGQFLGQNWNTMFTVTKIGIVTTLLFPIYTPYSIAHMLIFKTLGYSNIIAKEMNNTIISHQPKTYPTVKFPAASAKTKTSENIISFFTCVKSQNTLGDIQLNFYKEEGKIKARSDFADCHIDYELGFDDQTSTIIKENKKIKEALDITLDYDEIQKIILKNLVQETLKLADQASDVLFLPTNSNEKATVFNKYTIKDAPNPRYTEHWEGYCDEIFNFKALNPSVNSLNRVEKQQYLFLSSRCMSHEVVKRLVYPTEINDFSKYLKTKNYLKENHIEVCSHEYTEFNGLKTKALIKESDITGEQTLSEMEEEVRTNLNVKSLSIEDCLREQCSNLTGDYSNAYLCTNVINLYEQINKNNRMSETGFLTLGAYMYNLFSAPKINDNAKALFNGFQTKYAEDNAGETLKLPSALFSIDYTFIKPITNNKEKGINKNLVESSVVDTYRDLFEKRETQEEGVMNLFNFAESGESDFLGTKRFIVCMKNSLKIEQGYSCGSVPEEMNNFGRNLFEYAVYIKTMLAIYQTVYATMDIVKSIPEEQAGTKEQNVDSENDKAKEKNKTTKKTKSKNHFKTIVIRILSLIPAASTDIGNAFQSFSIDIVGKNMTETDDFGNLTTLRVENQLSDITNNSANGIAILAAWSSDTFIGDLINAGVDFIMLMGFILAYVIPLIPLYLWMMVIIGWFMLLFETIAILPIWIPTLTTPTGDHTSEIEKKGFAIILKLFLKAPLLCMGLLTAWVITNSVITRIMGFLNFDAVFSSEYGYNLSSTIDSLVLMFAYLIFLWYIINITITIIEAFYEFATSWLTGNPSSKVYGKDVSTGFLQKNSAQRQTMGMLNPIGRKRR